MKKYYIIGSGLQGCLTAFKLLKANIDASNITVIEKGRKLFPGWEYQSIAEHNVYLGFQGFEMPRAKSTLEMIIELTGSVSGTFRPNMRYVSINSETCLFNADKSRWPSIFLDSLPHQLTDADFSPSDLKEYFSRYQSTPFFQLIKKCSARYSDDWLDSIRFFYPWFFPNEFLVKDQTDEGMSFLSDLRAGKIFSTYFFPTDGFQALAQDITKALQARGVNFRLQYDGIDLLKRHENDCIIWTASSFPLLKYFSLEYTLKQQWIQSILYSTQDSLISSGCPNATEILTMDEHIPMMSRISFPSMQEISYTDKSKNLIQVEFFCADSLPISHQTIALASKSIKKILHMNPLYWIFAATTHLSS